MRIIRSLLIIFIGGVLLFGFIAPGAAPLSVTTPISDSMEPTAPQHSLVVITGGSVNVGDILLFESPRSDEPVLHRAVGKVDAGYITQGDANDVSDQAIGLAPVSPDRMDGSVPTIAGRPVIIPYLGGLLTNPAVLLGSWGLLGLSLLYTTRRGGVVRGEVTTISIRKYGIALAVIIIIGLPIVTALFAIPLQTEIVTSTTASPASSNIAAPGETSERTVTVTSPLFAVLHTAVIVEGDVALQEADSSIGEQAMRITVRNDPSDEPMVHDGYIRVYTYPSIVPGAVMKPIDAVHPVLASFVSSLIIGGLISGVSLAFDKHRIVRGTPKELRSHRNDRTRREKR